jgi:hypothetical protein
MSNINWDKANKFVVNYFKSKYDIDLSVLDNIADDKIIEQTDMDFYYAVKILNSLPEWIKELHDTNDTYKLLDDKLKELEHLPDTLKANKNSRKLIQERTKDVRDIISKAKTDIIFKYLESKVNFTEGHLTCEQDPSANIDYYSQTKVMTKDGKEYPFDKYLDNVFKYQFEFAKLTDNIDSTTFYLYELLATSHEWQDTINRIISEYKPFEFTLSVNIFKPTEMLKSELNDFYKTIKTIIDTASILLNRVLFFHKSDVINDIDGRAIYRKDPNQIFTNWQLYLDAYKLSISGHDYEEIFHIMNNKENPKSVEIPYFATKHYVDKAKELIKSTEQGTFPYVLDDDPSNEPTK